MMWFNGAITEHSEGRFDLSDRGLLLADGVFETVLVLDGRAVLLDEHLRRLASGCHQLQISWDPAIAAKAVNELVAAAPGDAVIRVTVTRGQGPRGLLPSAHARATVFASRAEWQLQLAFASRTLALSPIRRNASSPLSRIKSLAYLDNVLALMDAQKQGADDALLLNAEGHVACSSMANVFVLQGDTMLTPSLQTGVLDGITRGLVIRLAPLAGLTVREAAFDVEQLRRADAVFLTNSVRLIMPVSHFENWCPPEAGNGDLTRLMNLVQQELGLHHRTGSILEAGR
ncbi:aminotransferase class IV [Paraburkholderia sp. ZP32-5]|uniref:aminotransferase class IV n=1 Tax=Paraburkholderia sp. ZP32-5 TaxID=2883245 RepID=UPI001F261716|nr:aminotransferase class IV [Paraburkholderia sp. ZP32-5]